MLSLEAAIEKIKQLPPEEQQEVFKFIEFIDFKNKQESKIENSVFSGQTTEKLEEENFFSLAGIWENREIDINSLRKKAWREESK
ncbi:MAG: DUF2281 domain-containing protein [Crocosphaera sp.]